jgi:hypothetical protein
MGDAVVHIDESSAAEPFDANERWRVREAPETYHGRDLRRSLRRT